MKRKMLSLLLCCAMFLSLSLPAMATDTASEEKAQLAEQFSEAYMEKLLEYSACDELMSDAESEQILNRFSNRTIYVLVLLNLLRRISKMTCADMFLTVILKFCIIGILMKLSIFPVEQIVKFRRLIMLHWRRLNQLLPPKD